jgi:four helix bundle protein
MKIQRFEDLECWKEARKLVSMVYEAVHSSQDFRKDYGLKNQVTDAAVSVMSNIAEGFSRHSNKEFIQFLFISKSSASEVQSILYVTLDQTYIDQPAFDRIYTQAEKVSRLDSGLITYLLRNQNNYNNKKSDRKTRTSEVVLKSDKTQQTQ